MESATERAAQAYLAHGWSVVPVEPRGKRPLVRWKAFQKKRATPDEVRGWFERWPDANVSVVTGRLSGLIVVDVDPRHGGDTSLADLEREHGPLPATVESATGGGGRHLYFAHPGAGEIHNRVGFVAGVDVRGDGGSIVAPPSIHASGKRYAWKKGRAPDDIDPAPLPSWLLDLIT